MYKKTDIFLIKLFSDHLTVKAWSSRTMWNRKKLP